MKKKTSKKRAKKREKPLRREYDFSKGVRGALAERFPREATMVSIDPSVLDVFPDGDSVNEALRALAPVIRHGRRSA